MYPDGNTLMLRGYIPTLYLGRLSFVIYEAPTSPRHALTLDWGQLADRWVELTVGSVCFLLILRK